MHFESYTRHCKWDLVICLLFLCINWCVSWHMCILDHKIIDKNVVVITLREGQSAMVFYKPLVKTLLSKINEENTQHFLTLSLLHIITFEVAECSGSPFPCFMCNTFLFIYLFCFYIHWKFCITSTKVYESYLSV